MAVQSSDIDYIIRFYVIYVYTHPSRSEQFILTSEHCPEVAYFASDTTKTFFRGILQILLLRM